MTFIIFLIVLGILVFVHELGHFLVAKGAGVKVEEFGFGYPPRALKLGSKWGTLFTLNWIPFGGFVKIFGENYEENLVYKKEQKHTVPSSFTEVSKKWQAAILVAGVTFNIIFAWLILSLGFMIGLPTPIDNDYGVAVENPTLTVIEVISDSPAKEAGLRSGDKIKSLSFGGDQILSDLNLENTSYFINKSQGEILVKIDRGGEIIDFKITPNTKIGGDRKLIGISMDMIGTLSLPIHQAIYEGGKTTFDITYATIYGIGDLIGKAIKGDPDISQIAGPVGIISLVGDATKLGFVYLLTFMALISINLAIINLLPFPALDGGRIIFVIIESITKRPINPKIAGSLNTVGFALLILLMLIVTYRDILKLF